jgi:hypothetical protein
MGNGSQPSEAGQGVLKEHGLLLSHENNRRATGKMPVLLLFSSLVVALGPWQFP